MLILLLKLYIFKRNIDISPLFVIFELYESKDNNLYALGSTRKFII